MSRRERVCGLLIVWGCSAAVQADDAISYARDVRPILATKCWHCHGPDATARQSELRLDLQSAAHAPRDDSAAIVPGKPAASLLIQRITAADDDVRMPPSSEPRQLTDSEIQLLTRWIAGGGNYDQHWAFQAPRRPDPPPVHNRRWVRNAIDRFVLARLESHGLSPAAQADRRTLVRRVTLDLTGLPPQPEMVAEFLNDSRPDAYQRVVDRLLASPAYGERMALVWLDAARFADSGGYQGDILRSMWLWRDWVINAYNGNMPFDQFTREQLAGDLIPDATENQRIATGFNRNHRINDEDGIILEEFRVEYVVDRVETTSTVWLGLTVGCARCHDHKYDPISQREYYRLYAYFNSIAEKGRGHGNAPPLLRRIAPQLAGRIAELDVRLAAEKDKQARATLVKQRDQLVASAPSVMVMQELAEPRATHILIRGGYDRPGERVQPGVPAALDFSGEQQLAPTAAPPANRRALSKWIVDPRNPLTARVAVNRYWQMHFGRGLVDSVDDFGLRGSLPTHPGLLDWLATEFLRTGWNVKAMQRLIVTSATYRQSSSSTRELLQRDPQNALLARAARYRMDAETIRDQALAASGLLVQRLGGPSVKPYQPPGLWDELMSASRKYEVGSGADLYRRSMYTFVRRTVPHPSMTIIDAPNRETCAMRRPRTNTPTQALVLMNDPQLVEAARVLAESVLSRSAEDSDSEMLSRIIQRLLARPGSQRELEILNGSLRHYRARFQADPESARRLVAIGVAHPSTNLEVSELAAWTAVTNLILNLDETLTRE